MSFFFVLAIITSGRVNARFHHKKEGQMEVDWGVVICFRWGFLKECPFPSLQSGQNRGLTSLELQSAPAPLSEFRLKTKGNSGIQTSSAVNEVYVP